MARAFSAEEAARVRERLLAVAAARFAAVGLDGVSVAELAAEAAIGKGTFYLFFPSKEALLFAAHERVSDTARASVLGALSAYERAGDGPGLIAAFLRGTARAIVDHPLLRRLVEPGTIRALMRAMPPEAVAAHRAADAAWYARLQEDWAHLLAPDAPRDLLSQLATGVFALTLAQDVLDGDTVLETFCVGAGLRWGR